jgi:hypothetical protein
MLFHRNKYIRYKRNVGFYAAITLFLIILSFKLFSKHFPITNSNEDKTLVLVCSYQEKVKIIK